MSSPRSSPITVPTLHAFEGSAAFLAGCRKCRTKLSRSARLEVGTPAKSPPSARLRTHTFTMRKSFSSAACGSCNCLATCSWEPTSWGTAANSGHHRMSVEPLCLLRSQNTHKLVSKVQRHPARTCICKSIHCWCNKPHLFRRQIVGHQTPLLQCRVG